MKVCGYSVQLVLPCLGSDEIKESHSDRVNRIGIVCLITIALIVGLSILQSRTGLCFFESHVGKVLLTGGILFFAAGLTIVRCNKNNSIPLSQSIKAYSGAPDRDAIKAYYSNFLKNYPGKVYVEHKLANTTIYVYKTGLDLISSIDFNERNMPDTMQNLKQLIETTSTKIPLDFGAQNL